MINQEKNIKTEPAAFMRPTTLAESVSQAATEATSILGKRHFSMTEDALLKLSNFDKESAQNGMENFDDSNESEDKKLKR